jgi:hypothetical protein
MKEYTINAIGVCVNPEIEQVYIDKRFSAFAKYAFYNGVWAFGVDVMHSYPNDIGGFGFAASFSDNSHTFLNIEDCKKAALRCILKYMEGKEKGSNANLVAPVFATLKMHLSVTQLTLF